MSSTTLQPHIEATPNATPEEEYPLSRAAQGNTVNWTNLLFLIFFHAAAIAALFFFTWQAALVALFLWFVTIYVGIGIGYHRLLTHRGFKVSRPLKWLLAICGSLALEGGPIFWVVNHRIHHQRTDKLGDPHTPEEGGWWSHAGWVLTGTGLSNQPQLVAKYAPDLLADPFLVWIGKYHWLPLAVLSIALYAIGGWSWLLWGTFLRVTLGLHAVWFVNSATHMWGSRRFATKDNSRNLWWVAALTGGEGWHNNHHAHPVSARHGLAWYEIDINYYTIWLLGKLGLATNIQTAPMVSATKPQAK
ncbi:stearoyl-CoA desaturase (delta-9 desaturase) [Silvibacterium bohemicum]|uniref:Stearoyl-CoA desaturase (Delta-9 desaturase) n=1 Tax=Silvibacterium bohemicum TaxID=1577686 RepID=A0A841JY40_9BACT|nr:fatty acid desaturase [Silvibacterium bohemicum]MBB6145535.1 stearoyl-CoA desaturase (delta-9 desaturase) [Silvibacterium bohemicum]